MSTEEDLFVEGEDEVRFVAPVAHRTRAEADPVAAGPFGDPGRGLDLGGDDLDRPDAIPHLRRNGPEDLAALLRAFARVGNDLHRVLAYSADVRGDRTWRFVQLERARVHVSLRERRSGCAGIGGPRAGSTLVLPPGVGKGRLLVRDGPTPNRAC